MKKENSIIVTHLLTQELNVNLTKTSLSEELAKHPAFPSIFAISSILDNFQIPNAAYELPFKKLDQIPIPFIATLSGNSKELVLITKVEKNNFTISNEQWDKKSISSDDFEKVFGGYILIAESEESSGEKNYKDKLKSEFLKEYGWLILSVLSLVTFITILVFYSSFFVSINPLIAILTLIKSVGLAATILLLVQSIDSNNPLIKKLCTGNKVNCKAILSSDAAKVFNGLSWSEFGFFYFIGSILTLFFNSSSAAVMQILIFLSILCLPYTVYSIYHQFKIAKQWCVLCCTVQGVLWLDFIVIILTFPFIKTAPSSQEWLNLLMCFSIPVLIWYIIRPILIKSKLVGELKTQLESFRYNQLIFDSVLEQQPIYPMLEESNVITIGNPEAENTITVVSSPSCKPCAELHSKLDEFLLSREDVKIQIVFAVRDTPEDQDNIVATHLLSLNLSKDKALVMSALTDWYSQKEKIYDSWASSYPSNKELIVQEKLKNQLDWGRLIQVTFTPTVLVNGRKLPDVYQFEDIKYML